MSNDTEYARRQAEADYTRNQQSQMASEQAIRNAEVRNAYNAELARQRAESDRR